MLGQCPKLKLVFLNSCSTEGQVAALQANEVPGILATSSPVEDKKATDFSINQRGEMLVEIAAEE